MTTSLKFYADAGLTQEITQLIIPQLADGSTSDVDNVVYLGSTVTSSDFQATSDPGVDNIVVSINDSDPGNGVETTNIKLALSAGALGAATAGAALSVGVLIEGGTANAVAIHVRSDTPALASSDTAISLATNNVTEIL